MAAAAAPVDERSTADKVLDIIDDSAMSFDVKVMHVIAECDGRDELLLESDRPHAVCGTTAARVIGEMLKRNTSILNLVVSLRGMGDDGSAAIASGLGANYTLVSVHIRRCNIIDSGVAAFSEALAAHPSIRKFGLYFNTISDEGAAHIAEMLKTNTVLQSLTIHRHNLGALGAGGLSALANALKTNVCLKKLNIFSTVTQMGPGLVTVAEMLECNTSLMSFKLFYIGIGDDDTAMIHVWDAMTRNKTLTRLHVHGYTHGRDSAMAMARAIGSTSTIKNVNISIGYIGDEALSALGLAIKKNGSIAKLELNLRSVRIRQDGTHGGIDISDVMDGIGANSSIRLLKILNNSDNVEEVGRSVAHMLKTNYTIARLNLYPHMQESFYEYMEDALETNTTLLDVDFPLPRPIRGGTAEPMFRLTDRNKELALCRQVKAARHS